MNNKKEEKVITQFLVLTDENYWLYTGTDVIEMKERIAEHVKGSDGIDDVWIYKVDYNKCNRLEFGYETESEAVDETIEYDFNRFEKGGFFQIPENGDKEF